MEATAMAVMTVMTVVAAIPMDPVTRSDKLLPKNT